MNDQPHIMLNIAPVSEKTPEEINRLSEGIIGKPFKSDDGSTVGRIESVMVEDGWLKANVSVFSDLIISKIIAEGAKNISYEIRNM